MKRLLIPLSILPIILIVALLWVHNRPRATATPIVYTAPLYTPATADGVERDTNDYRISLGLAPLAINQQFCNSATAKSNDMVARNYWSHDTPDGKTPWSFFSGDYTKMAENLEYEQHPWFGSAGVLRAWEDSPEHDANLRDPALTSFCVTVFYGTYLGMTDTQLVVAHYGSL